MQVYTQQQWSEMYAAGRVRLLTQGEEPGRAVVDDQEGATLNPDPETAEAYGADAVVFVAD